MSSPVDDALGRLERVAESLDAERLIGSASDIRESLATVRDALQQLREERDEARRTADGMARAPYGEFESMRQRAEAAEARCTQLEQALANAREARRGIIAACIAVKGKLDQPYSDDKRWTPWTRFVEPALRLLDEALAGPDTPEGES